MKELTDLKHLTIKASFASLVLLWEETQKVRQGQSKKPTIQMFHPPKDSSQTYQVSIDRLIDLRQALCVRSSETSARVSGKTVRVGISERPIMSDDFRSERVRKFFVCVSSIVNTGKRQGLSVLDSILIVLDPLKFLFFVS